MNKLILKSMESKMAHRLDNQSMSFCLFVLDAVINVVQSYYRAGEFPSNQQCLRLSSVSSGTFWTDPRCHKLRSRIERHLIRDE